MKKTAYGDNHEKIDDILDFAQQVFSTKDYISKGTSTFISMNKQYLGSSTLEVLVDEARNLFSE